jgi:hypothetical protein
MRAQRTSLAFPEGLIWDRQSEAKNSVLRLWTDSLAMTAMVQISWKLLLPKRAM